MKINETNFVTQLYKKNEKALLYVIDQYGGLLHSIVQKHLYSFPDMQEECLNDILMAIWENISSFDVSKNTFKNWAAAIARYKSMDYLRKYLKDLQNTSWEELDVFVASTDDSIEQITNRELSEELEVMLSCLSPSDRELFLKLFYEERGIDEISQETGQKREIIYNRVSRGKKRIREHYSRVKGV